MAKVVISGPMSGSMRAKIEVYDGIAHMLSAKDRKAVMRRAMHKTCTRFARHYLPKRFSDYVRGYGFSYQYRGGKMDPTPMVETGLTERKATRHYRIKITGSSTKGMTGRVGWDTPEYIDRDRNLRRVLDYAPRHESSALAEFYVDALIDAISGATSRKLKSGRVVTSIGGGRNG